MIDTWDENATQKQTLIEQIRAAVAAQRLKASELRGRPRSDAPSVGLEELENTLNAGKNAATDPAIKAIVVDEPYPPCTASIADLRPIFLKDLRLEVRHDGYILFARRIGEVATHAVGGTYGIQDEQGTVELLIYDGFNYPGDDLVPPDAIVAIKHPYCKIDARGNPRIKVSHPTDLVVLKATDERIPLDWRVDGLVISDTVRGSSRNEHSSPQTREIHYDTNKTEVRSSSLGGRGLFAKQVFKSGDTVLTECAIFSMSQDNARTYHALKFDTSRNMMTEDTLGAPYKELCRNLISNPHHLNKVYQLHAGSTTPPCDPEKRVDGAPVLNIFHIHDVFQKNGIGFSGDARPGCGLWLRTAYINHCCLPNVERLIEGEVLVLRAVKDIEQDEEITMSYGDFSSQQEKQQAFQRIWDFTCTCTLCQEMPQS